MIKLIYSLIALLFSSAMYLFSSTETVKICNQELTGVVKEYNSQQGKSLIVEGSDHVIYHPRIESSKVVLLSGTSVKICYEPYKTISDTERIIRVIDVTCLP